VRTDSNGASCRLRTLSYAIRSLYAAGLRPHFLWRVASSRMQSLHVSSVMSPGGPSVWLRKTIEDRVAVYADETRKNCRAARTDGSLRVPPTCRPRRSRLHDTATSHCDFTTPHNGHSVRHRYEESALHKKIESWGSKIIVSMPFLRSFAPMGLGSSPAGNCGMGTHVGRQPHEGRIR
jgi:hypothetical protein